VDDRVPTNVFIVELENAGLAVRATKDSPVRFRKGWDAKACEEWLEGLLPQVFEFHKDKRGNMKFTLLTKKGKKLEPVPLKQKPAGEDFFSFKSRKGGQISDSQIYIGMFTAFSTSQT
jgi:hypothetical protein